MKLPETCWLVAAIALVAGCATSETNERKKSSSTTDLGPQASVEAAASTTTKEKLGIVEWKIFRSKKDLHLTGYDAKGRAVKGLTAGFSTAKDGSEPVLRTKLNDGSGFAAVHGLRSNSQRATKPALGDSAAFTQAAFADVSKIHGLFAATVKATPAAPGAQCGADLSIIIARALQCMQAKKEAKAEQAACLVAAKKAAAASASCKGTGATAPASSKGTIPASGGAAKKTSSPGAGTSKTTSGGAKPDRTTTDDDELDDLDELDLDDVDVDDGELDDLDLAELDDADLFGADDELDVDDVDGDVGLGDLGLDDAGGYGDDDLYADYDGGDDFGGGDE